MINDKDVVKSSGFSNSGAEINEHKSTMSEASVTRKERKLRVLRIYLL